jgi:integrase/recombinase XerD
MRHLDPERRCMPPSEWPEADRLAWQRACLPGDPFHPDVGYAQRWKASTRANIEQGWGRYLTWLKLTGRLEVEANPGERITRDLLRAYTASMEAQKLADNSRAGRLQQIHSALQAMSPTGDWGWILRASDRIRADAKPVRSAVERMQPVKEVLQLGDDLMHAAENDRFRTPMDRAVLFRDGLIIGFLARRPLRGGNLADFTLETSADHRQEDFRVCIAGSSTKSGRAIEFDWPPPLEAELKRYLERHRPELLKGRERAPSQVNALWVSKRGTKMTFDAISFQVQDRTKETFGKAINLHTFRHIAATTIAEANAGRSTDIKDVLDHSSMTASEKYYNRAEMIGASRDYAASLEALRGGKGGKASQGELF